MQSSQQNRPKPKLDFRDSQRRSRFYAAAILIIVVLASMVYAGARNSRRSAAGISPAEVGQKQAPDFTLRDLQGRDVKLSDFHDKAVLLNFWATWCGPCNLEIPWLVELQNRYRAQGLEIVGVAMDDSGRDDIQRFVKEKGMNYVVLKGNDDIADKYGEIGLPTSFYIDRQGKIIHSTAGLVSKSEIEENIRNALETRPCSNHSADSSSKSAS